MKNIMIELYSFQELSPEAQETALKDHAEYHANINWDNEEYIPDFVEQALIQIREAGYPCYLKQAIFNIGIDHLTIELEERGEVFQKNGAIH